MELLLLAHGLLLNPHGKLRRAELVKKECEKEDSDTQKYCEQPEVLLSAMISFEEGCCLPPAEVVAAFCSFQ